MALLGLPLAFGASAQAPLSAIDWLSDVTTAPLPQPISPEALRREEAVSRGVISETILVTPLDAPNADAVGIVPTQISGLPPDLWGPSGGELLALRMGEIGSEDLLPATRALLFTMLLSELDAPLDSDGTGAFLLARAATLTRLGAVEQAQAMLERAGVTRPAQFAQWFDLSVFLGRETEACRALASTPRLSPDFGVRIFCLARSGDWAAAALSLETGHALGLLEPQEEALLRRFLDVELDDSAAPLAEPSSPSPLVFHLFEAIGEPLPTTTLPLPFAHADLRPNSGWKAQVEASERLARAGALPANQLLGAYTARRPAASGGVWDRAAAIQRFDQAISAGDAPAILRTLPQVWEAMQGAGLAPVFAELYGARLRLFPLEGAAARIAFHIGLLTEDYETVAQARSPRGSGDALLVALATGDVEGLAPQTPRGAALAEAFRAQTVPARFAREVEDRAIGAALLAAIDLLGEGREGDLGKLTDALALFRTLGLERVARRAALELVILDPRG